MNFLHPDASPLRRFWLYWWVVPRAQWDLFDLPYQLYTFDLFHGDRRTRLTHFVTIPAIMLFSLALLARWPLWPGAPALLTAATAYAAGVALVHLPWCLARSLPALWLVTTGVLAVLGLGGTAFHRWTAVPGGPWYAPGPLAANPLLWIYLLGLVETLSHSLEPVPPYTNGQGRWMSPAEFRRTGGVRTLLAGLATPTIFTLASLASNPRTLAMVVLRAMLAAGYRRELGEATRAVVAAEWRSGQPRIHRVPPHPA